MKGTVKWFSNQKGYGFITPDDKSADVFVHYTTVEGEGFKTLIEGDRVEFEVEESKKGLQAVDVTKI
jgi:CspA family cold shock protein